MAELPNVRLDLSSNPENVLLVREMLSGVAEAVDLDAKDLDDIHIAVSEACNNVVLHAYEGREGPLEVEVSVHPGALDVVVRDHGSGMTYQMPAPNQMPTPTRTTSGIGLLLIQALADWVEFKDRAGEGSEVRMRFGTPNIRQLGLVDMEGVELKPPMITQVKSAAIMVVAIAPSALGRTVLPRVLSTLAARGHFSTDRISDVQILVDALVARTAESFSRSHLSVAANIQPRKLELHIAPLGAGQAKRLIVESAVKGLDVIDKLTDNYCVKTVGSYEVLALQVVDRR